MVSDRLRRYGLGLTALTLAVAPARAAPIPERVADVAPVVPPSARGLCARLPLTADVSEAQMFECYEGLPDGMVCRLTYTSWGPGYRCEPAAETKPGMESNSKGE